MNILKNLKKDKRGVIWVWTIIIVGLFVYSLIWFTTGWAFIEVADAVEDQYTFTGSASYAASFMRLMFEYHPILFLFGMILWGYINSQRRDPRFE